MEHVTGQTEPLSGCLFEPDGEESQDKDQLLLLKNDDVVVLLNRYPYANGHLLIAPRKHTGCITGLTPLENSTLFAMVQKATSILQEHFNCDGVNIGCNIGAVAGAGIADHLHVHLVPRWKDDHNFMTIVADIRTIPEHIEITFDALLPYFQNL